MPKDSNPIYITKPFLPPLDDFVVYLKDIWETRVLTNNGKYHEMLERALCEYLDVKYISLFSNGTLALITALQALKITGEVITTPYSFVATSHALWWNRIKPVFVDIEMDYCNLDPDKIESAITPATTAILPVHVYGNPCSMEKIQNIADIYGLKVIYDAAHAFGVKINNKSVLNFGDLSVLSFHATKVYNTFEGGAIVCHDEKTKKRIDFLKNFGFYDETVVMAPGINAKMNEFQAALGLLQLKHIDNVFLDRDRVAKNYNRALSGIDGLKILNRVPNTVQNYTYYPVLISNRLADRDTVYKKMREKEIIVRRYFYPLISDFPMYKDLDSAKKGNLEVADTIKNEILCLPIYPEMDDETQEYIITEFKSALNV